MAAKLNRAKRAVNAVWKVFGQEPVFKNSRVEGSSDDSDFSAAATVDDSANTFAAVRGGSTRQSIDSDASADSREARIGQLSQAWSEPSTLVVQHQDEKKPEQLQEMPKLADSLAAFKSKELSDDDINTIYSIIVEEIKNASKYGTTQNMIIQNISKDLGPLNLTTEHLEKLLSTILGSQNDTLALVHGTFKKIISGYENNARLPNMCEEIVGEMRGDQHSKDQIHTNVLDKIYSIIQDEIKNKRPTDTLTKVLEKIGILEKYLVNNTNFMLDPQLSGNKTLQVDDLQYLLDRASQETTTEKRLIIDKLQSKICEWLNTTKVDKKEAYRKYFEEPHNPELEAEINEIIRSLKAGEDTFDPMAMAILSYYLDACIKKHEIEGSPKIGIFSQDIKQLLVDESGKKFKEGLAEKSDANDTNTLHAPESTDELPTSSNLREKSSSDHPVVATLTEKTPAAVFTSRLLPKTKR